MKKRVIIIVIILAIAIIGGVAIWFMVQEEESKTVDHNQVNEVYQGIKSNNCSTALHIEKIQNVSELSDESISYLVLNEMKKDKLLSDEISFNDFKKTSKEVFGEEVVPSTMDNYLFDGYEYTLENNTITRTKSECGNIEYVSKLYGYSGTDDSLEVDLRIGYIENNKVYDMDGKELGDYSKDTLNEMLDNSTLQVYKYARNGDQFYLEEIGVR